MTDPSKAYLQSKQPSPKNLDDQLLAAAKDQAELNAATRKVAGSNWMQTAAFASVCLVGLSFVFDSQFTSVSDPYAEYAQVQSLSEGQQDLAQSSLSGGVSESEFALEATAEEAPVRALIDTRQPVAQIPNGVEIDLDGVLADASLELDNLQQIPIEPTEIEFEFDTVNNFAAADTLITAGAAEPVLEPASTLVNQAQEIYALEEIIVTARRVEEPFNDVPSLGGRARTALDSETGKTLQSQNGTFQDQATQNEATNETLYSAAAAFADVSDSADIVSPRPNLVNLIDYIPNFAYDLRYLGENNFVGRPIDGYLNEVVLLSAEAAEALAMVQIAANRQGLGVKVFDAYRPQLAVDHFVQWVQDLNDQGTKQDYYPNVNKADLFEQGYIAEQSGHSRGSTVDLTLIDFASGIELDMGTPFDFFDPLSWPLSAEVSEQVQQNRLLLRSLMVEQGFVPYDAEWWHFTLADEPYPDQYFDLPLE